MKSPEPFHTWYERGTRTGHTSELSATANRLSRGNSAAYLTGWPDGTISRALLGEQMDKAGNHCARDAGLLRRVGGAGQHSDKLQHSA